MSFLTISSSANAATSSETEQGSLVDQTINKNLNPNSIKDSMMGIEDVLSKKIYDDVSNIKDEVVEQKSTTQEVDNDDSYVNIGLFNDESLDEGFFYLALSNGPIGSETESVFSDSSVSRNEDFGIKVPLGSHYLIHDVG